MFSSNFRSIARRGILLARSLAIPKKESSRVEITKPATHPDFTGYTNSVQFRQHAEPFLCYRCNFQRSCVRLAIQPDTCSRIMNEDGQIIAPKEDPNFPQEKVVAM